MTALFVDCGDTDILDMHVNPPAPQACQEQPLLVEDLAEALWSYED
jgi:hypothetical protein